mmetsp:Transcript_13493/g.30591  ORF Transcript_13493/g.30591 Transcript_13493/m.30591 type:complete len:131 (+) Transcript_13493:94-486(+)
MAASAFARLLTLGSLIFGTLAKRHDLRGESTSKFTIKDKIFVDGALFVESAAIGDGLMCHVHAGTSKFKVCGCGAKVIAHLLSECQTYEQYDEQIGHCDCGSSACDERTLTTGYTSPFEWKATSFEISAC